MKRLSVLLLICALALPMAGCTLDSLFGGGASTITTKTTMPDGTVKETTETLTDDTAFVRAQVDLAEKQKPIVEMEAKDGESIELKGVKAFRVYANNQNSIKQYESALSRIFINGMPLITMVAQGYISADMAKSIVGSLGAMKTTQTYQITTADGSPVNIANGSITNGAVTVTQSPTTTTSTDNHAGTGAETTTGTGQ